MAYTPSIEPDPREEKLPRWARELLDNMRRRVEWAERTAEQARLDTKPGETNTLLYRYGDPPIGLPLGATVQFRLRPDSGVQAHGRDYIQCRVETDNTGTHLHVLGSDFIAFHPRSSNHALITTKER